MQQQVALGLDGVLTVSDLSLVDIPREMGIPAERVQMVPLGVDPDVFPRSGGAPSRAGSSSSPALTCRSRA